MYTFANAAARLRPGTHRRGGLWVLPSLWLMTDAVRMEDPVAAVLRLPRGSGVILRHTDPARLRALAEILVPLCRRRRVMCLIAGDWRLAARLKADGVHLPERMARYGTVAATLLWRRQSGHVLTTAAHGLRAMVDGVRLKTDAILLAPVFTTASHPRTRTLGAVRFTALVRQVSCPVLALGGITAGTIKRLTASGASGIAGISWNVN